MELTDIPGEELQLQLTETMQNDLGLPKELDGLFRIGEVSTFDALELAARGGVGLAPEVALLADAHAFSVVRIPVSIRPPERAALRFLAVEVTLTSDGGAAVGWSMDPQAVHDPVTVSTSVGLSATLAVSLAEIGPELQRSTEYVVRQPRITAFNIGASDPAWEFSPTKAGPLAGVQILHLVVKSPTGTPWSGAVAMRADVTYRGMLWNTRIVRRDSEMRVAEFDQGGARPRPIADRSPAPSHD